MSAHGLARTAARHIWPGHEREYCELLILRAKIATALGLRGQARKFLSLDFRELVPQAVDGASYAELLGRAHVARALLNYRTPGQDVTIDIADAREYFENLGLACLVAHCDWLRYKLEPDSHGLTRRCVTTLEHRLPDPRDGCAPSPSGTARWIGTP